MPHALIVEDDPNSLSGLSAILAADGFSVDTATTLAEARAALTRFIPDVVLVDLNLPDGSGLDLLPASARATARRRLARHRDDRQRHRRKRD